MTTVAIVGPPTKGPGPGNTNEDLFPTYNFMSSIYGMGFYTVYIQVYFRAFRSVPNSEKGPTLTTRSSTGSKKSIVLARKLPTIAFHTFSPNHQFHQHGTMSFAFIEFTSVLH